jgi:Golgi phosphoprotein 3 (GPP34)
VLLAEELALVALNPESGRHAIGVRSQLNACLAGLLVAELLLDGRAEPYETSGVVVATGGATSSSSTLEAAAGVVAEKGPKINAMLSDMDRNLSRRLGAGTWDSVMSGLVRDGVVSVRGGSHRPRYELVDVAARDSVVERLRAAAVTDGALDGRTALVLSMTGPAQLLGAVAPARPDRRHARDRIDHALDSTDFEPVGDVVRQLISEAAAAAAAGATVAVIVATSS